MRGTEIANYLKNRVEAEAKVAKVIKAKTEEEIVMEEIAQEEQQHEFNRLAREW